MTFVPAASAQIYLRLKTTKATACHSSRKPHWARSWVKLPPQPVQVHRTPQRTSSRCGSSVPRVGADRLGRAPVSAHGSHPPGQGGSVRRTQAERELRATVTGTGCSYAPAPLSRACHLSASVRDSLSNTPAGEKLALSRAGLALPPAAPGQTSLSPRLPPRSPPHPLPP